MVEENDDGDAMRKTGNIAGNDHHSNDGNTPRAHTTQVTTQVTTKWTRVQQPR